MKRTILMVLLLCMACMFSGCAYVNVKTPYDTDLDKTVLGEKVGESSCHSVLWLVAWGDAGTAAAAKNGNITVIHHMDHQALCVLFGLYSRSTTIVYGD